MVEDVNNFFTRLADNWYGTTADSVDGWSPDIASQFGINPTKGIGYYRLDTGNPTRDAIFSVAMNNLGFDNAMRASLAREQGEWKTYWKEIAGGVAEVALFGTGGALKGGLIPVAKGISRVANTMRRAPITSIKPGVPVYERAVRQLGGELGPVRELTRAYTPITINTARTGARPISQLQPRAAAGRAVDAFADKGWRGVGRAILDGTRKAPGGRFGLLAGAATGATLYMGGRKGSEPNITATERAAITGITPPGAPEAPAPNTTQFPAQTQALADAANEARVNVGAIQRQYDNIFRELQGMYQLAETDQEKERLRFMLGDIEAQRDAGLQAISEGYTKTVVAIQQRATLSREQTQERSQRYGDELNAQRDAAAQRMMLQNTAQQQQYRGLGSGSADPTNEWVGLMSALGPSQQQYTQRMGDITAEGIDWMADTTAGQGLAQQADLQRLAAATRSGAIMTHQQQVDARIQREREQQRQAMQQMLSEQARAMQSAQQFNAQLTGGAQDRRSQILGLGLEYGLPVSGQESYFGGKFSPEDTALADWARREYERNQALALARIGQSSIPD